MAIPIKPLIKSTPISLVWESQSKVNNIGEKITINSSENIESIDVLNILGEKVFTKKANTINTTNLPKGTYVVILKLSDGREVDNKIVIQ